MNIGLTDERHLMVLNHTRKPLA